MFKSVITLAVALSMTTPAMAEPWETYRGAISPNQIGRVSNETRNQQQADQIANSGSSYVEGRTHGQVEYALDMQQRAVKMCRKGNFNDSLKRAGTEAGSQVLVSLVNKVLNNRSIYIGSGGYSNSGYESTQDCDSIGRQVYQDALMALPDSYCDESMTATYGRGGQAIGGEHMVRRCQSRVADSSWSRDFQPQNK
jgi:hypothetical protein